jgi:hypothetical protein
MGDGGRGGGGGGAIATEHYYLERRNCPLPSLHQQSTNPHQTHLDFELRENGKKKVQKRFGPRQNALEEPGIVHKNGRSRG